MNRMWVAGLLALSVMAPAWAQLVVVSDDYVIESVKPGKSELVVSPVAAQTRDASDVAGRFDVVISPQTQVLDHGGRPINWRTLKAGEEIHVNGGLRFDVRITAEKIVLESN